MRLSVAVVNLFLAAALASCTADTEPPADGSQSDAGVIVELPDSGEPPSCLESDFDGDGYGTSAACAVIDCEDRNLGIYPGAFEACNGLDDDCDEAIDEELGETPCGTGVCARSVPNCVNGRPQACTPGAGTPELCNNLDDDCNGSIDDGVAGETCGVGACARTAACVNGGFEMCTPGASSGESCNRADDDCDGTIDNGFRAVVINSTYSALRLRHAQCDGAGQRMGPDCNAAIHRFCAGEGCSTTGFGPLENSGDTSIVGCVVAGALLDTPFAALAQHHPPCDGAGQRIGPDCNAAIHRYCLSMGFASGFGPLEQGASTALVGCVTAAQATVLETSYTVLSGHHDGCNAGTRIGPACNAAINRFCASSGFSTGYGPVENSGDVAFVTCVSP